MDQAVQNYLSQHEVLPETLAFLSKPQKMFVAGQWIDGADGQTSNVVEPATGGKLTEIPQGTATDVDVAVTAAKAQFEDGQWSELKPAEREVLLHRLADLIQQNAQQLAQIESIDMGKSVNDALEVDVQGTIDTFRYFAGWATKIDGRTCTPSLPGEYLAYTRKEPVGVVASVIPWNFPLQTMAWKLGAALAVGCTVVVKPAELTSLSTLRFAELVEQAGFPPGVVNIVTGKGSVVGKALTEHPDVNKVTFTGSTEVGIGVGKAAIEGMKHTTLELGGKSPVLVFDDADIEKATDAVINGVFFNSGQVCDAGTRLYVQSGIYQQFVDVLVAKTAELPIKPGLDKDCFISPLVCRAQLESVKDYIQIGLAEGAVLATGGSEPDGDGFFLQPTIFTDCSNEMTIVKEEIFGPVLTVSQFDSEQQALALANDSIYGLAAAIYSNNLSLVHSLIPKLQAGSVYVNAHSTIDPAMPFGGYKQSGIGKDLGPEQLDYFLQTKAVWITL